MALGKRYVAIADNGLGLRVAPVLPEYAHVAELPIKESERRGVLCIDLDACTIAPVGASDESLAMHWERVELRAAEERAKYWHAVKDRLGEETSAPYDDRAAMRAVIEAQRAICNAAIEWARPNHASPVKATVALQMAIAANRDRLAAAISAFDATDGARCTLVTAHDMAGLAAAHAVFARHHGVPNASTLGSQLLAAVDDIGRVVGAPPIATDINTTVCSSCDQSCNSACGCGDTHHYCGCECHRVAERAALDARRSGK